AVDTPEPSGPTDQPTNASSTNHVANPPGQRTRVAPHSLFPPSSTGGPPRTFCSVVSTSAFSVPNAIGRAEPDGSTKMRSPSPSAASRAAGDPEAAGSDSAGAGGTGESTSALACEPGFRAVAVRLKHCGPTPRFPTPAFHGPPRASTFAVSVTTTAPGV